MRKRHHGTETPRGHGSDGADPRPPDRGCVFAVIFVVVLAKVLLEDIFKVTTIFTKVLDGILTLTQWYSLKRFIYCIHNGVAVAIEPPLLRTVLIEDGK